MGVGVILCVLFYKPLKKPRKLLRTYHEYYKCTLNLRGNYYLNPITQDYFDLAKDPNSHK